MTAKNAMLTSQAWGEFGHERRIGVFLLVCFVDRGCCSCFFLQYFFPRVRELRHDFWEVFCFLPMKSFGHALVVGAR